MVGLKRKYFVCGFLSCENLQFWGWLDISEKTQPPSTNLHRGAETLNLTKKKMIFQIYIYNEVLKKYL
jgi:hypothetical protein